MPVSKTKAMQGADKARAYTDGLLLGFRTLVTKTRKPIYMYEILEDALKLSQKGFMWTIQIQSLLATKTIKPKELPSVKYDPTILIDTLKNKDWPKAVSALEALIKYIDVIAEELDKNIADVNSRQYVRAHNAAYTSIKEAAFAIAGLRVEIIQRAKL